MCLLAAAGLLLSLGFAAPAGAEEPFALEYQVTDRVGAIDGGTTAISAAFDELELQHGIRMWVVFVDSFDGTNRWGWADAAFEATGLGSSDFLLAVAMGDRQFGYVVADDFALSDTALARVADAAERHLAENPSRAVVAAAAAMEDQITRSGHLTPTSAPESSDYPPLWVVAIFALMVAAILGNGFRRVRRGLPFFAPSSGDRHTPGFGHNSWHDGGNSSHGDGGGGNRGGGGSF
jgi:uncharacterized membrane protein YgcG